MEGTGNKENNLITKKIEFFFKDTNQETPFLINKKDIYFFIDEKKGKKKNIIKKNIIKLIIFYIFLNIYLLFLQFCINKKKFINYNKIKYNNTNTTNNNNSLNNNKNTKTNKEIKNNNQNFVFNGFLSSSYYHSDKERQEAIEKGKQFFELCMNKILIDRKTFIKTKNPLISIIIPVYNSEDKLWGTIRSVQNQNILNIEIVLVNDFSNTITNEVINQMVKEDPRILLINNKKNMGTFYSRCIGTLYSNGKYIFPLDNDDLFFDETVLDIMTSEADKEHFDIIEFKGAERYEYNTFTTSFKDSEYSNHVHNLTLYQPMLGQYARRKNNIFGIYDCFLWAKCIKSEVYKNTVNSIGKEIYSEYIIWGEDLITSFVLFRIAKSFRFISKYGISRFKSMSTASNRTPPQALYLSKILYVQILLKFTDNNFYDKKIVVKEVRSLLFSIRKLDSNNRKYLKKVLESILDNKFISNNDKDKIRPSYVLLEKIN